MREKPPELKLRRLKMFNVAHLCHALYGIGSPGLATRFKLECAQLCLIILVHPLSRYTLCICTALGQDRGKEKTHFRRLSYPSSGGRRRARFPPVWHGRHGHKIPHHQ